VPGGGRTPWLLVLAVLAVAALALGHRAEIRDRAELALGRGMPAREAELARGFVLGEDDRIDAATVEDFRRAGLSHLLAVSGQNVALLALLVMPLLAALGMSLRTRLVWIIAAIAVYVPLAGGGPSIVRAGVMGALTLLATLAGRRASRLYALAIAAIVTLAIDPGVGADVGWQLSFAAVLGILAFARWLRTAIASQLGSGGLRGALAEGAAVTVAATLATAPLIAFHFGALSTVSLVANLLALPAVAPAMWLGMLVSIGAQVPGFPAAIPNALAAPLLAYIAQVAAWCSRPGWAYLNVRLGLGGLIACYGFLGATATAGPWLLRRRALAGARRPKTRHRARCTALSVQWLEKALRQRGRRRIAGLTVVALVALALACLPVLGGADGAAPISGLRISVLDVGQGDAILLQPANAPAVLVDGGPPGDGLAGKLRDFGVDSLGAAILTHEQSDHAGGIEDLLGHLPIEQLLYARLSRRLRAAAEAAGVDPIRISAGGALRSGRLRLSVLWPPPELLGNSLAGADPNAQAVVVLARWDRFSILLTADAEAEEVPIEPGPVDVLKVAHHGSEDAGLDGLLDHASPQLAVISVGADNPYGHPAPGTLAALAEHGVRMLLRMRRASIALLALVGAVGLGLIVFISQLGWPGVVSGPLPGPPTEAGTVHNAIALSEAARGGDAAGPAAIAAGRPAQRLSQRGSRGSRAGGHSQLGDGKKLAAAPGAQPGQGSDQPAAQPPSQPATPAPVTSPPAPAPTTAVVESPPQSSTADQAKKAAANAKATETSVAKAVSDASKSAAEIASKARGQKSSSDKGTSSSKASEAASAKAKRDESAAKAKANAPSTAAVTPEKSAPAGASPAAAKEAADAANAR
jgi:competence protein ComEC